MPVKLEGSCHCRKVRFTVLSHTPVPYQLCQCSICRKVGGFGGSVNIMGETKSLEIVKGKEYIKEYQAVKAFNPDDSVKETCDSKRSFCGECSSMLWLWDETWADWIYPFASSIDSPSLLHTLPSQGPSRTGSTDTEEKKPALFVVMRGSAPGHVPVPEGSVVYEEYAPGEGIEAWHKKHGLWVD